MNTERTSNTARPTVAVIGGGALGVGFALRVALAGHVARVCEKDEARLAEIPEAVTSRLEPLVRHGLVDESVAEVAARVETVTTVARAVQGCALVQECATEQLDLKRALVSDLAHHLAPGIPLASSSSALGPSQIFDGTPAEAAGLVGHPLNPPYLLPVIEVVPTTRTDPGVLARANEVYRGLGLRPVMLHREVDGFVTNRLQAALLREAYLLVADGVVEPDDLDAVVRDGLGQRWSFMGPFETADLNTRGGIAAHAERLGTAYGRFGRERDGRDPWRTDVVDRVTAARRRELPLSVWDQRVRWRDEQLVRRHAHRAAQQENREEQE